MIRPPLSHAAQIRATKRQARRSASEMRLLRQATRQDNVLRRDLSGPDEADMADD